MSLFGTPEDRLRTLLWLVALHSFGVGLGLVLHPETLFARVGLAPLTQPLWRPHLPPPRISGGRVGVWLGLSGVGMALLCVPIILALLGLNLISVQVAGL